MQQATLIPFVLAIALLPTHATGEHTRATHGIAMHGDLKYGPEFQHFDYVNPQTPKVGELRQMALGLVVALIGGGIANGGTMLGGLSLLGLGVALAATGAVLMLYHAILRRSAKA